MTEDADFRYEALDSVFVVVLSVGQEQLGLGPLDDDDVFPGFGLMRNDSAGPCEGGVDAGYL